MARQFAQKTNLFFSYSGGSFAANAASSGSARSDGFSKLRGLFYSDFDTETGSGLQIRQSMDGGQNWLYTSASDLIAASTIAACGVDIYGDAIWVDIRGGGSNASNARWKFYLLPI